MNPTDNQLENTHKPWLWKKGQSGNILGRPKGKTMKEYAKQYLERMTDEERDEWLDGIPKERIWEMGEGKADSKTDITSAGLPIIQIAEAVANKNNLPKDDTAHSTE
jgi:hypothetical protein